MTEKRTATKPSKPPEKTVAEHLHPRPAALIDLIIARAPALHAAGVTSLAIEGFTVTLQAPPPPPPPPLEKPKASTQHIDPMLDPATYAGGRIPGFERPKQEEE